MRQRNLPAEFARAGTPLVLVPRTDSVSGFEAWRRHVGEIVASGLEHSVAIRAITLEPAALLGVDDRVGSLEAGKDANILILSGDPLEPGTQVDAVILEGKLVSGEVNL
jgi:imidazolonepropionase-like amidohydrolase